MQDNAKLNYLYAFEVAFRALCIKAEINPARWQQGMWTNAHMYYGTMSAEDGATRWFEHVEKQEAALPKPRSYSPFEDSMEYHESFCK